MKLKTSVTGIRQMADVLRDIDKKVARKAVRDGVNDATKLILKAVRSKMRSAGVVDRTGALRRSLGRRVRSYQAGLIAFGIIGARKDAEGKTPKFDVQMVHKGGGNPMLVRPSKYLHLVEFGTAPHLVGKGAARYVRVRTGGKWKNGKWKTKRVLVAQSGSGRMHPGAAPKPFVRPAWDETRGPAIQAIYSRVAQSLKDMAASRVVRR